MQELIIDGEPVTFQTDWYVCARTGGAMPTEERERLLASRGASWHAAPEDGDGESALETRTVLVGRYENGRLALAAQGEDGLMETVSVNLPHEPIKGPLTLWIDPAAAYTALEMERAGLLADTGIQACYGAYGTLTRLMRLTPADETATMQAIHTAMTGNNE
ncbi:hypothetical protein BW14_06115 [Bifidobacterium sp. UTBIF-68]|uniref:hypothetical protein n=1 Tax=Bifidobacterium sp. UTBIF-68 TaxID=1465262 RepID=UPI0011273C25|nr:hypothetical protein [Bifidobacterium sp. UTBIF-68]TPF93249.1 hypothetical protein BW14_06115 [Bifidobacterium sp. UTBIF-68]